MPRRRSPPRLYLDPRRHVWIIRDGTHFQRTGCLEADRAGAEKALGRYLADRHQPERGPDPLITDVLLVYARDHLPHTKATQNASYSLARLAKWWGDRRASDITAASTREYARGRAPVSARRDLETLRAATRYYNRERELLGSPCVVVLPPSPEPRERWLTRSEAARLLSAARRTEHLKRFILIGLYTGSRSKNILSLRWEQIDLRAGIMRRLAYGEAEEKTKRAPPVRLGRRILSHLRRWHRMDIRAGHAMSDYVCHYAGRRLIKFRTSWNSAVARAGLEGVTPHTLRHTRATWLMAAGVSPWEAAGHLGMSVGMLTRVYGKHSPDFQRKAAEV